MIFDELGLPRDMGLGEKPFQIIGVAGEKNTN